jgi:hypothetical protein
VICATENSNQFQKVRFWKEKSVEDVVTLGPAAQATLEGNEIHRCSLFCISVYTKLYSNLQVFPFVLLGAKPPIEMILHKLVPICGTLLVWYLISSGEHEIHY